MDDNNNHVAIEHSPRSVDAVRSVELYPGLRRIDTKVWTPERLNWIWEQVKTQEYAFDELGENNAEFFIANLFAPCNEHYELRDDAYFCVLNLVAGVGGDWHSAAWGDVNPREMIKVHNAVYRHLIQEWEINRLTTYVPDYNVPAKRLATIGGYRYEGTVRQCFKKAGKYHDVDIFGLLKSEFQRKWEGASCLKAR